MPPGADREVRFASGHAGTYHYWATTMGAPVPFRELAGPSSSTPPAGRPNRSHLVITEWSDLTPRSSRDHRLDDPSAAFLADAPESDLRHQRLVVARDRAADYRVGEPVRWRVINLSSQTHPMHLHGSTSRCSVGTASATTVAGAEGRRVVTQMLAAGGTLRWMDAGAGGQLAVPLPRHAPRVARAQARAGPADGGAPAHGSGTRRTHDPAPSLGMAGMVLGITVTGRGDAPSAAPRQRRSRDAA